LTEIVGQKFYTKRLYAVVKEPLEDIIYSSKQTNKRKNVDNSKYAIETHKMPKIHNGVIIAKID
jgi:hypothetical protein